MRIQINQIAPFTLNPLTDKGRSAVIDGNATFTSTDESIVLVESTGPISGRILSTGKPGVAQVIAKFDADLGQGVREITVTASVEVAEPEAVTGVIEFGEAIDAPSEEPAPPEQIPTPVLYPWQHPIELFNVPEGATVPKLAIGDAVVNLKDFNPVPYDGQTDNTVALKAAIAALPAEGGTLIIPAGVWGVLPTEKSWARGNLRIYWEDDAWLRAIPNSDDRAYVLLLLDMLHVELWNPRIWGDRLEHNYVTFPVVTNSDGTTRPNARDTHEWGHGIAIRGKSQYINVLLGRSEKCTGDGMSCGGSDLFIYGWTGQFNRRQGLTLGSAKNSKIYNSDFLDTGAYEGNAGTMPMAGVDIEPDAPNDSRGIHIYGCRSLRNRVGYEVYGNATPVNGDYAEVTDFAIENSEAGFNVLGVSLTGIKRGAVRGCNIHDNDASGLQTVARVDGLELDNNTYSRNYLRNGEPAARDFWLAGTSSQTSRDILLKGTPTNVTYPNPSHFI